MYRTVWAAADAIWKHALPWKRVVWLGLRTIVVVTDYVLLISRRALLLLLVGLVAMSLPDMIKARERIAAQVLAWFPEDSDA